GGDVPCRAWSSLVAALRDRRRRGTPCLAWRRRTLRQGRPRVVRLRRRARAHDARRIGRQRRRQHAAQALPRAHRTARLRGWRGRPVHPHRPRPGRVRRRDPARRRHRPRRRDDPPGARRQKPRIPDGLIVAAPKKPESADGLPTQPTPPAPRPAPHYTPAQPDHTRVRTRPPSPVHDAAAFGLPEHPPCPFCRRAETELHSPFGPQLSVSTYWCQTCHTVFELLRPRT